MNGLNMLQQFSKRMYLRLYFYVIIDKGSIKFKHI